MLRESCCEIACYEIARCERACYESQVTRVMLRDCMLRESMLRESCYDNACYDNACYESAYYDNSCYESACCENNKTKQREYQLKNMAFIVKLWGNGIFKIRKMRSNEMTILTLKLFETKFIKSYTPALDSQNFERVAVYIIYKNT